MSASLHAFLVEEDNEADPVRGLVEEIQRRNSKKAFRDIIDRVSALFAAHPTPQLLHRATSLVVAHWEEPSNWVAIRALLSGLRRALSAEEAARTALAAHDSTDAAEALDSLLSSALPPERQREFPPANLPLSLLEDFCVVFGLSSPTPGVTAFVDAWLRTLFREDGPEIPSGALDDSSSLIRALRIPASDGASVGIEPSLANRILVEAARARPSGWGRLVELAEVLFPHDADRQRAAIEPLIDIAQSRRQLRAAAFLRQAAAVDIRDSQADGGEEGEEGVEEGVQEEQDAPVRIELGPRGPGLRFSAFQVSRVAMLSQQNEETGERPPATSVHLARLKERSEGSNVVGLPDDTVLHIPRRVRVERAEEGGEEESERKGHFARALQMVPALYREECLFSVLQAHRLASALAYAGTDAGLQLRLLVWLLREGRFRAARVIAQTLEGEEYEGEGGGVASHSPRSPRARSEAWVRMAEEEWQRAYARGALAAREAVSSWLLERGDVTPADLGVLLSNSLNPPTPARSGKHWGPALELRGPLRDVEEVGSVRSSVFASDYPVDPEVETKIDLFLVESSRDLRVLSQVLRLDEEGEGAEEPGWPVVGVDVEWRPSSKFDTRIPGFKSPPDPPTCVIVPRKWVWPASTLQLSTLHAVFVVDLLGLTVERTESREEVDAAWDAAIGALWRSDRWVKTGYGLAGDVGKLSASYPWWDAGTWDAGRRLLELPAWLRASYGRCRNEALAHGAMDAAVAATGLTDAVRAIFGAPLKKEQQVSDWQRRPLAAAQLRYAALDAVAVVRLSAAPHGTTEEVRSAAVGEGVKEKDRAKQRLVFAECLPEEEWRSGDFLQPDVEAGDESASLRRPPPRGVSELDLSRAREWMRRWYLPFAAHHHLADASHPSPGPSASGLGPDAVRDALLEAGLPADRLVPVETSPTAADAAVALEVSVHRIVKSLAFFVAGQPVLALLPGDVRLAQAKLASAMGATSRKQVRLATPKECLEVWGYLPGAFPPGGHRRRDLPVLLDASLAEADGDLYAGGGAETMMVRLSWSELQRFTRGRVVDLRRAPPSTRGAPDGGREDGEKGAKRGGRAEWVKREAEPAAGAGGGGSMGGGEDADGGLLDPEDAREVDARYLPPEREATLGDEELQRAIFRPPRFVLDNNLSRLTRWLRVVGIDSVHAAQEDRAWVQRCAHVEDRIILTRDAKLVTRNNGMPVLYLPQNDTGAQFEMVTNVFGLTCSADDLMSRCAACNSPGYFVLTPEEVARRPDQGGVAPKVIDAVDEFYECRKCGKLYWTGPKFYQTRDKFANLMDSTADAERVRREAENARDGGP